MYFRHIQEGDGGTLPIEGEGIKPSVGTFFLMTCVAVYFRVDEKRCFFAHIDARSGEFEEHAQVTKEAGGEIAKQVKQRLRQTLQYDKWDIFDSFFGNDLVIEAPCKRDMKFDGRSYETPAKYVVKGIQEFFSACAKVVEEEAERLDLRDRPSSSKGSKGKQPDPKVAEVKEKARSLNHIAQHPDINDVHQILIIDPRDGKVTRQGRVRDPGRSAKHSDLDASVYEYQTLRPDMWRMGVLEDIMWKLKKKVEYLPTEEQRAERKKELVANWEKWQSFGGEPVGEVQERLMELLVLG